LKGKWVFPNGTIYEGVFENNKPNTNGIYNIKNKNIVGEFFFKNGNTVKGVYK